MQETNITIGEKVQEIIKEEKIKIMRTTTDMINTTPQEQEASEIGTTRTTQNYEREKDLFNSPNSISNEETVAVSDNIEEISSPQSDYEKVQEEYEKHKEDFRHFWTEEGLNYINSTQKTGNTDWTFQPFSIPRYADLGSIEVVGLGNTGSWTALALSKAGFSIIVHDFDKVENHNTISQLYTHSDVGKYKTEALVLEHEKGDDSYFATHKVTKGTGFNLDSRAVVCLVDSMDARLVVLQAAMRNPQIRYFIDSRTSPYHTRIMFVDLWNKDSCWAYLNEWHTDEDATETTCGDGNTSTVEMGMQVASYITNVLKNIQYNGRVGEDIRVMPSLIDIDLVLGDIVYEHGKYSR